MQRKRLIVLTEISMITALSVVFTMITPFKFFWLYGGEVSFAMVPIVLLSFRRGIYAGVCSGLLTGMIHLFMPGAILLHPAQIFLDYIMTYALLGTAGLFPLLKEQKRGIQVVVLCLGTLTAGLLKLCSHFLSGVIFFKQYTPVGESIYWYSLAYNASYMVPDMITAFIVLVIVLYVAPQMMVRQTSFRKLTKTSR